VRTDLFLQRKIARLSLNSDVTDSPVKPSLFDLAPAQSFRGTLARSSQKDSTGQRLRRPCVSVSALFIQIFLQCQHIRAIRSAMIVKPHRDIRHGKQQSQHFKVIGKNLDIDGLESLIHGDMKGMIE